MAEDVIKKTGRRIDRVYVIVVEDDEPKYSSFCVIPRDAFGYGKAALAYNNYEWPRDIERNHIDESEKDKIDSIADRAIAEGYENVWLVEKDNVDIIR